jgi:penicillin-binding protein 2
MHSDEITKSRAFSRRAFFVTAGKVSLLSLLAGRLYYMQIIKGSEYKTLSDKNSIRLAFTSPQRGNIYDRNGVTLATTESYYRLVLDPTYSGNHEELIRKISSLITLSEAQLTALQNKFQHRKPASSIYLLDNLSWQNVIKLEVQSTELNGIFVEMAQIRLYPFNNIYAHLIGYIANPSADEMKRNQALRYPNIQLGKVGIEKNYEGHLRGSPGVKRIEVNAHGEVIREISREEPKNGNNLVLTVDNRLQQFITNKIANLVAAVVVMDVHTGDIIAMNSSPSFDPNQLVGTIQQDYWNSIIHNPNLPLINRPLAQHYAPGSPFKLITILAGLEAGLKLDTKFVCEGSVTVKNRTFHCTKVHGEINMLQAIKYSCNCYCYNIAKKIDIENVAKMAYKMGLGAKTNIEIPGEVSGIIPTKKWKKHKYKEDWQIGDSLNMVIGQGFVTATPLQMATMVARIANGQKKIKPTIIARSNNNINNHNHSAFDDLEIPDDYLNVIRMGMEATVNSPQGSAYKGRINKDSLQMAGKTGTAQVISKKHAKEDLNSKSIPWESRNNSWFVSYAPVHQPRYSCAVIVEHGGAGAIAVPLARDIFLEMDRLAMF